MTTRYMGAHVEILANALTEYQKTIDPADYVQNRMAQDMLHELRKDDANVLIERPDPAQFGSNPYDNWVRPSA